MAKMTDKERILMVIVSRVIPGLAYSMLPERDQYIESCMLCPDKLQCGDLVFANTAFVPNDFMVGFVERVELNCVVIREIGSKRLCNYFNEGFTKINKERLGYEILEGVQYQIYEKALKAFSKYAQYGTKFKSISFDDDLCTIEARKMFDNNTFFTVQFSCSRRTTIKEIGSVLTKAEAAQAGEGGQ